MIYMSCAPQAMSRDPALGGVTSPTRSDLLSAGWLVEDKDLEVTGKHEDALVEPDAVKNAILARGLPSLLLPS